MSSNGVARVPFPPVPSWDHCCQLVAATLQATGADPQLGMKLHSLFVGAGLTAPSLRYASIVGADSDHVHLTTLLPDMVRLGLVADGEIDPDTLSDDVLADVSASGSIVVGRSDIGAWTHVTG
jgi:hypothetical protein